MRRCVMETKVCTQCGQEKPLDNFHSSGGPNGRAACKQCRSLSGKHLIVDRTRRGVCTRCGKSPVDLGYVTCERCRNKFGNRQIELRQERKDAGVCDKCRIPVRPGQITCDDCMNIVVERARENKRRAIALLGGKCADCGLVTDILAVYDFHHNGGTTNKEHSMAFIKTMKWEPYWREASKCILLCSNCHRIRHAFGRGRLWGEGNNK